MVILGNFTNSNDTGFNEWENYTKFVVVKDDSDGDGNPEYVHVWVLKHQQFVNETGLVNITIRGVYWYVDNNDNGLRDQWVIKGVKIVRIDTNMDGIWDEETETTIYRTGSDE